MRRFSLAVLRDLGMGRSSSQQRILDEARHLLDTFSNYKGEPFDTSAPLNYAASNVISSIVYGTRFSLDDPYFTRMVQRANHNFKLSGSASMQVYNLFPAIGRWVRNREQLVRNSKENQLDMSSLIGRLRDSLNPADCRGFVDAFIMRQHTEQKAAGGSEPVFHEKNLVNCVSNLFSAGTDTTGTTLRWALLLMAKYPHIQERVHEELERVIGSRLPVADDRRLLPVTDAVLHETQRLANVFPMSLPHRTTQDVNIMGYRIKKGTSVFPLLASVLNDETEWEEPNRFHPEHFLDADGGFRKRDAFMPFSAGRRVCLGEALAKMELFLIFVSLLQRFRFTAPPGVSEEELDLTPVVGSTLNPPPHKLCALPRT
ncbi:cytochrome P450 2K1-like isoform X2 [Engraulis encrasicolus]